MITVAEFEPFEAKHCETAATKSLLQHQGIDMSEPMMLGLGQGFGFIYWKMSFMNLPFIGGRAKPFELTRVLCANLGLELDERETSSVKKAWLNLSEPLNGGEPVGLQLDCYHLEHFNHSFHFAGHFVSISGYDAHHVHVFDTGNCYKVSRDNLEKARFEKGSMAAKARSYTIRKGGSITPIKSIIPKAIHEIARGFLNPPLKCFGCDGIQKLGREMVNWLENTPDPPKDLYDQAELMENGGTGGAIFRNFFRDFLYESLEYFPGDTRIIRSADLYARAADNWTETARLIKQAAASGEKARLLEASRICLQTALIEKEAMEILIGV